MQRNWFMPGAVLVSECNFWSDLLGGQTRQNTGRDIVSGSGYTRVPALVK